MFLTLKKKLRKVFDDEFRAFVKTIINPYGIGNSANQIIDVMKNVSLEGIIQKRFYE
jgi:UDP-N-acetylglucosamine 2-epimerase